MNTVNNIKLSIILLVLSGIAASLFFPYFPIDETRYLAVAWEMKLHHSIVPLLNGLPYPHKPPFLFFLINLDWLIFGTNEQTLRLIPLFFSFLNVLITYRIALILWGDKKIARYATAILASTSIYLLWSTLIMFDIVLTFWVLVGMYGLLSATKSNVKTTLMLIGLSIGGGLLTKGPVIFVHILPTSLFYFLWRSQDRPEAKKWYPKIFLAIFIGLAIALLWVIPAAIEGGEVYRKAILWGQTVDRITVSFDHQHPIWWYLPILPGLLFPWVLVKPVWHGFSLIKSDDGYRFLILWIVSTLTIFSLISCKQVHYLIPALPAVSLLIAKNLATYDKNTPRYDKAHYPVAIFYILVGISILLAMPFIEVEGILEFILLPAVVAIFVGSIILFMKPQSANKLITIIALSSVVILITVEFAGSYNFFNRYDIRNIAHILREKQGEGYTIIHNKKYHGQYQFIGRLTQPLVVLNNKKSIAEYVKIHKKSLLVTYEKPKNAIAKSMVLYQQQYRGKKVVLLGERGIRYFLNPDKAN